MNAHSLVGLLVFASFLAAGAAKKPDLAQVEGLVIEGTNAFRREQGLPPLRPNRELEASARAFAGYMALHGKLSHEADGSTPALRATRHGYEHCVIAENIARQYSTAGFATGELARGLVEGWKNSPGHRKNMLDADVDDTGVAIAQRALKGHPDYYAVQLFGRPRSARIEFEVRNLAGTAVKYRVGNRPFTLAARQVRVHTECGQRPLQFDVAVAGQFTAGKGDKFVVTSARGQVSVRRE